jgi:DNA-binding Lrp family transcriptional regulator
MNFLRIKIVEGLLLLLMYPEIGRIIGLSITRVHYRIEKLKKMEIPKFTKDRNHNFRIYENKKYDENVIKQLTDDNILKNTQFLNLQQLVARIN